MSCQPILKRKKDLVPALLPHPGRILLEVGSRASVDAADDTNVEVPGRSGVEVVGRAGASVPHPLICSSLRMWSPAPVFPIASAPVTTSPRISSKLLPRGRLPSPRPLRPGAALVASFPLAHVSSCDLSMRALLVCVLHTRCL